MSDHIWIVVAGITSILSALILIFSNVLVPIRKAIYRQFPFKVFFVITSQDRYVLHYVKQDFQEHLIKELTLPANTKNIYIQLVFRPRLSFVQNGFVFGFDDVDNRRTKPIIDKFQINFIERGRKEEAPEMMGSDHYTDHHKLYHIPGIRHRAAGQFVTYGFVVTTRQSGNYKAQISMNVDGLPIDRYLNVRVEDTPSTPMRCHDHEACLIRPVSPNPQKLKEPA